MESIYQRRCSNNCTRSCWRTQCWPFCGHSVFEANWKSEKTRYVGALWTDCKSKKNCPFKVLSLILRKNDEPFLDQIYDMQWKVHFIWQLTSSVVGLRWPAWWLGWENAPKQFPKPNLHQKKVMVTVWWSAVCLICDSFLNLSEVITDEKYSQQINEMHQKLQCLQPAAGQQKKPNSSPWQCLAPRHTTNASKVERIGLRSFAPFVIFTWSLTNWLPLLQASQQFCRQNASTGSRKYFLRVCQIPKHGFLHYRKKQIYFSLAKMCCS